MRETKNLNKLILALNFFDSSSARFWIDYTKDHIDFYKVGLQLLYSSFWDIVNYIEAQNYYYDTDLKVMLDLKLVDVPHTIADATTIISNKKIKYLTLYNGNNYGIIESVSLQFRPKVLGVIELTTIKINRMSDDEFVAQALYIKSLGCGGIVCPPDRLIPVRREIKDDFKLISPGIVLNKNNKLGHEAVATPEEAIKNGANYIVMGRAIFQTGRVVETIKEVKKDIERL